MSEDIHDYSAFKQETDQVGGNLMSALISLADQQDAAQAEVERLELLLDEAKKNHDRISQIEIPKLMDGIDGKLNLPDGRVVTISEKIRSSISSDKKSLAFKWLDENDHGGLIKRRFIIEFGRDQEEWAKKFEADLAKSKKPLNVKQEQNVHWQTLDAFVRQQLENGDELPLELFGVFRQRFANIKSAQ
jgi:hypothetical protein